MKKVLFMIGATAFLFVVSFLCSYGIYKKTSEYKDVLHQSITETEATGGQTKETTQLSKETLETLTKQNISSEASETTDSETDDAYQYWVRSLNGYVAVFTSSGSLYEFTDILLADLDKDVRERIRNGIKFQKEKELFTFLESCSS